MNGKALVLAWVLAGAGVMWATPEKQADEAPESPPGLVLRWAFDEGEGTTTTADPGQVGLRLLGAAWVKGIEGGALSLDGEVTYLDCADGALPEAVPGKAGGKAGSFSISCWIRTRVNRHRHPIVVKQGQLTRGFMFSVERDDRLEFQLFTEEQLETEVRSTTLVTPRQWHHVAVTYEFAGNGKSELRLYLNGKQEARTTTAVGPVKGNELPLEVGRIAWSTAYARYLAGRVDELRFYDRALQPDEVAGLAKRPSGEDEGDARWADE